MRRVSVLIATPSARRREGRRRLCNAVERHQGGQRVEVCVGALEGSGEDGSDRCVPLSAHAGPLRGGSLCVFIIGIDSGAHRGVLILRRHRAPAAVCGGPTAEERKLYRLFESDEGRLEGQRQRIDERADIGPLSLVTLRRPRIAGRSIGRARLGKAMVGNEVSERAASARPLRPLDGGLNSLEEHRILVRREPSLNDEAGVDEGREV